jgi:ABC-type dipeptide/oligopeptide/nickel transport system permease subunit
MSAAAETLPEPAREALPLWGRALRRLMADRVGRTALLVVLLYLLVALGAWFGAWGGNWSEISGGRWDGVSAQHWFGTNMIGQDIFARTLYSTGTAFQVGLLVAVIAVATGALLGALAGFFQGGWLDALVLWLAGVLDAIPFYLFIAAVAFALQGSAWAMHVGMIACFWTGTARLVRGEVIRLRSLDYVAAARALGVADLVIIVRHILPNTSHILLVQGSLVFVAAIKAEVILSFLGLGITDGMSWGLMIAESTQEVLAGFFNNFLAASLALFGLVMAFNLFADALQDALDPRRGDP